MLHIIPTENVLFLDIETVPQHDDFQTLTDVEKKLWEHKTQSQRLTKDEETPADVYNKAAIYAEFGRIVCISVGCILNENGKRKWWIKSFVDDNETALLQGFASTVNQFYKSKQRAWMCGHNSKEFDFPYIARRMLVNGVSLPAALQVFGQKPWETTFLDTMELWKFGDYKHFTSLALLAHIFAIPTPKDDIDGSMVADVYYKEKDLPRIVHYCEKDVLTVARLFLKFKGESGLE
ncbi:3'-5' exonuclease [Bacteroidia bacterium]|nr:3'-5' exonuclease [Bacteroidia bacterium]